jgi:phosphoglycerol transferase MdoB-like AlkP superfamily enzyme
VTDAAAVWLAFACALALSTGLERWLTPQPLWRRPWGSWAIQAGVFGLSHGALVLLLGHPWFAAAVVCALMLVVVVVNNAKVRALREPFVFADYEYFTDAIRHPRLFVPFLGWGNALAIAAGVVAAVALGLQVESAPAQRWALSGQFGAVLGLIATAALCLAAGARQAVCLSFDPQRDLAVLGLVASLWHGAMAARQPPSVLASPFDEPEVAQSLSHPSNPSPSLPHLVAVQSESFFDPRAVCPGIRRDVLAEFDSVAASSLMHGTLQVPAWGANTVRSEFAFVSGLDDALLGAHRFNPYQAVAGGWTVPTLASFLKHRGYRTVCIHPYPASFYRRDRVYPLLGFDEFIDIRSFTDADRCGPFVGDAAVAAKIAAIVESSSEPVFVFAITMENHGPLHLEKVAPTDVAELYCDAPPPGCDDLTIYLRHLRNADRMIGALRQSLDRSDRPASLCWFGDHVPSMPGVYETLGSPVGPTAFALWSTHGARRSEPVPLAAHQLAVEWLRALGLMDAR